ncbi:MAG: hypothetical protein R2912_09255 [Eubacteriales bacterium]
MKILRCSILPNLQGIRQGCAGCKTGYDDGTRDIAKAEVRHEGMLRPAGFGQLRDCGQYDSCEILAAFYGHESYKYKKYRRRRRFYPAQTDTTRFSGLPTLARRVWDMAINHIKTD